MSSLFDCDDSDSSSSHSSIMCDDETTFTVATVLEKRDKSRRDTITRTMPTISIHDKYDMPTTVQRKEMKQHQHLELEVEEQRTTLRVTASLMDDSDSDGDEVVGISSKKSHEMDNSMIFRTPAQADNQQVSATKSTVLRKNTSITLDHASKQTNLLDVEVEKESRDEIFNDDIDFSSQGGIKRTNSIDTFNSVYDELAFNNRTPAAKPQQLKEMIDTKYAAAKGTKVKALVTTALKSVADGLVAHATSNARNELLDAETNQQLSGKKRSIELFDESSIIRGDNTHRRNKRKSVDVQAELIAMQSMVDEKTDECTILQDKLDASQSQIEGLREEASIVLQSKAILDSRLEIANEGRRTAETNATAAREEADAALAKLESLSSQNDTLAFQLKRSTEDRRVAEANASMFQAEADGAKSTLEALSTQRDALKSKLETANEAFREAEVNTSRAQAEADVANAKIQSISTELTDSQSKVNELTLHLKTQQKKNDETTRAVNLVTDRLQMAESELARAKQKMEVSEKERESLRSRNELQDEVTYMRVALKDIREMENARSKESLRMKAELHAARKALAKFTSTAAILEKENDSLRAQIKQRETPAGKWKMEWEEGTEGVEVQMSDATTPKIANINNAPITPKTTSLAKINEMGAEENSSDILTRSLPASRQLSFGNKTINLAEKENNINTMTVQQQSECSLCYRPSRPNVTIKRCQCGKEDCCKWAHASCLVHTKSVSSSVSHPGTPAPPLPTILCGSLWTNEI